MADGRSSAGIAAAILAGGQARRLGGTNKAGLRVGHVSIAERLAGILRSVADPVFVVSSRGDVTPPQGLELVHDELPGTGPLGGIYTAIRRSPVARTIVVACDMPFVTEELLRLLARPSTADLVIPRSAAGYEPLCAAWSRTCAGAIRRRLERGDRKAALLVEDVCVEEIGPEMLQRCDPDGRLFVNVNTPHDYERALELNRAAGQDD